MVRTVSRYTARFTIFSPRYIRTANESEYGKFYIFDSAEATAKHLENQSGTGCTAEVIQRLNQMLHSLTHLLSHKNSCIK
jgi:hypothetical protein